MKVLDILICEVPDSFVYSKIKLAEGTGNGEGKLYVGTITDKERLETLFNSTSKIIVKRDNLREYLDKTYLAYTYNIFGNYREADESYWDEMKEEIQKLKEKEEIEELIEPFISERRYYIRLKNNIFQKIIRRISLPKISNYRFSLIEEEQEKFILMEVLLKDNLKEEVKRDYNDMISEIKEKDFPHNRILYGAPGTGKSYLLKKQVEENFNTSERVTFYDGYTYGQFVGMYKPIPDKDDSITYKYIPGSFMRLLVSALKNTEESFCLIIEELNRAKADKVFGNIFQLLDRDDENRSNYSIAVSEDQIGYLEVVLKDNSEILNSILEKGLYIPNNFYIWSTMNSADQGVYPLDSAFKRRWSFEHVGLNENEKEFEIGKYFVTYKLDELDKDNKEVIESEKEIEWNTFRRKINEILLEKKFPEDRLLAPFFISKKDFKLEDSRYLLNQEVFLNKILVYLFDDILRHKDKELLFSGDCLSFSSLKNIFNEGKNIFNFSFDNINTSDELEKENE